MGLEIVPPADLRQRLPNSSVILSWWDLLPEIQGYAFHCLNKESCSLHFLACQCLALPLSTTASHNCLLLTLRLCQVKFNLLDLWWCTILSSQDSSVLSNRSHSKWHLFTVLHVLYSNQREFLFAADQKNHCYIKTALLLRVELPAPSIRKPTLSFGKGFCFPSLFWGAILKLALFHLAYSFLM